MFIGKEGNVLFCIAVFLDVCSQHFTFYKKTVSLLFYIGLEFNGRINAEFKRKIGFFILGCSGVPAFRCSGVPAFRILVDAPVSTFIFILCLSFNLKLAYIRLQWLLILSTVCCDSTEPIKTSIGSVSSVLSSS